jgi:hypothetical protein
MPPLQDQQDEVTKDNTVCCNKQGDVSAADCDAKLHMHVLCLLLLSLALQASLCITCTFM